MINPMNVNKKLFVFTLPNSDMYSNIPNASISIPIVAITIYVYEPLTLFFSTATHPLRIWTRFLYTYFTIYSRERKYGLNLYGK